MSTMGSLNRFLWTDWNNQYSDHMKQKRASGVDWRSRVKPSSMREGLGRAFNEQRVNAAANKIFVSDELGRSATRVDMLKHEVKGFGASVKNASGIWSKIKTVGGGIMKKMPVIGNVLTVAMEVPALARAAKNGDLLQQLGRSTANIAGGAGGIAVGAAIGTAIFPGVGSIIGGIIGGFVGCSIGKTGGEAICGKSIHDQRKEAEEAAMQQGLPATGFQICA